MKKHSIAVFLIILIAVTISFLFGNEIDTVAQADIRLTTDTLHTKLLSFERGGISNADLYNHLGLSFYKRGETGKAVVYFLRSLRLNSNHRDAINNLEYIKERILDRDLSAQPSFLTATFSTIFRFFTLNHLALLVLLFLILTVMSLHWMMHLSAEEDKVVPVLWLVIFSILFVILSAMFALKYKEFHKDTRAVVIEYKAEGFSGPGEEYGKLFTIHEGLIVHINRQEKEWVLITLPNGGAGWVRTSDVLRVKPDSNFP